jgi:hypothetical protein
LRARETREPLLFLQAPRKTDDRELLPPDNLLKLIAYDAVAVGLARTIPAGQIYFRARYQQPGETLRHPSEFGPPTHKGAPRACANKDRIALQFGFTLGRKIAR